MTRASAAWLSILVLLGCSSAEIITDCRPHAGLRPVCGFRNPEDLVALPDGGVLVSQMGRMDGTRPGSLVHFDPLAEQLTSLFPTAGAGATVDVAAPGPASSGGAGWGAADCPGPPGAEFSPHGIDLSQRADGRLALLVVNHGGRESIEFFEVALGAEPGLSWRGCVVAPEPHYLNDVAALPGGGFLATHMFPKAGGLVGAYHAIRAMLGAETGYVLEWTPESGLREVPGTAGAMPNGITVSSDGQTLFVNLYMGGEVRRVRRDGSEPTVSVELPSPDNITWSRDGRLLVASHRSSLGELLSCSDLEAGSCGIEFAIVALDPDTLEIETVFRSAGAPMGAGTVALHHGDELLIGSFAGDRILRVPFGS